MRVCVCLFICLPVYLQYFQCACDFSQVLNRKFTQEFYHTKYLYLSKYMCVSVRKTAKLNNLTFFIIRFRCVVYTRVHCSNDGIICENRRLSHYTLTDRGPIKL